MTYQPTTFAVTQQGAVGVQAAHIYRKSDNIAAIFLDVREKHPICVAAFGQHVPVVALAIAAAPGITDVELIEFGGWEIFAVECSGHTVNIALVKPNQ